MSHYMIIFTLHNNINDLCANVRNLLEIIPSQIATEGYPVVFLCVLLLGIKRDVYKVCCCVMKCLPCYYQSAENEFSDCILGVLFLR
jgi:hypothetical protein